MANASGIVTKIHSMEFPSQFWRGSEKTLTTHLARHTFATTVTLSNGVPIESVSKMLGHTSLKTTQIYAKVLDSKISDDMEKLKNDPALIEFAKSI